MASRLASRWPHRAAAATAVPGSLSEFHADLYVRTLSNIGVYKAGLQLSDADVAGTDKSQSCGASRPP